MTTIPFKHSPVGENDILVCKTDTDGVLTYANDAFTRACGQNERALVGQRHNFLSHPDMPHSIVAAVQQRLQAGSETFALLKNGCKNGSEYWTFAQFSPCRDASGRITGCHTVQRWVSPEAVAEVEPLYRRLRQAETAAGDGEPGLQAGRNLLGDHLIQCRLEYDEFVLALTLRHDRLAA